MNKALLMGRLTRDPETRYTKDQLAVTRYTLAVNRKGKDQGPERNPGGGNADDDPKGRPDKGVDFIDCVAFGKAGEFAEKYFHKGQQIAVAGRLQVRDWEDKTGTKRRSTEVIIEEQYFAGGREEARAEATPTTARRDALTRAKAQQPQPKKEPAFYPAEIEDCDLPF